jgi:undecaprenyl diphosphate synthase
MSLEQLLAWIPPGSADVELAREIQPDRLPQHVAIIMDGNGRWAGRRHLPRVEGHRAGIQSVREVLETSARLGLRVLTLYAFSVENWKRPAAEVSTLMMLLRRYLRSELSTLLENNIRFNVIGRLDGRAEIVDAARAAIAAGLSPDQLTESRFAEFLYTKDQPDPDLLIRTSGEMRISNFLLWQIAYAEIYVTETYWPDFRRRDLLEAIAAYQKRDRRYGGIAAPVAAGVE